MIKDEILEVSCRIYFILSYDKHKSKTCAPPTHTEGILRFPGFLDSWHMKVVRLSALRTYPQEDSPGTQFC